MLSADKIESKHNRLQVGQYLLVVFLKQRG